jgi:transaldolase
MSARPVAFSLRRPVLAARVAAGGNAPSSSVDEVVTELDAVASFSEIVPDTVVFDDFEKFAPTAATVSSSLLLGIAGLPDTKFKSAIDTALADGECNTMEKPEDRMSCFLTKALANVGAEMAHLVPGRVSTEIDARLAYDTQGIIQRVHELLKLYSDHDVLSERLLFKIPATWQGIEASRLLESEGIQTHLTFVYRYVHMLCLI